MLCDLQPGSVQGQGTAGDAGAPHSGHQESKWWQLLHPMEHAEGASRRIGWNLACSSKAHGRILNVDAQVDVESHWMGAKILVQ